LKWANDANHTPTTLATLNGTNGAYPAARLIADAGGNLYGTTSNNGANLGYGTVFKVANDANHTLTTLATFDYITYGAYPFAGLIADAGGNLYGTTIGGGDNLGSGIVFHVAHDATPSLTVLATAIPTHGV